MTNTPSFQDWLSALPVSNGLHHISPQRAYQHAEDQYDQQYGVDQDHPEEGLGLCALIRSRGYDVSGPALEIGCGTGYLTTGLTAGCDYPDLVITDPSPRFIELTRERLKLRGPVKTRLHSAVLNGDDLGRLPAGMFSLIALRSTLHHILDVDGFLRDCARALRPGGVVAMSAEPCEEGYVLMGAVAHGIPTVLQARGIELKPAWQEQIDLFLATMKFYCRRDLDKSEAEDKHLFRIHELSRTALINGLALEFLANANYADFNQDPPVARFGSFTGFFPPYLRYCMGFDPELVELITTHLGPQLAYVDSCYPSHTGPVFNGVYLFSKPDR